MRSVVDRFAQIEPKVLIAVDGYRYGGKDFDRMDVVASLQDEMDSLVADRRAARTSTRTPTRPAGRRDDLGRPRRPRATARTSSSPSCPSSTRCGSCTRAGTTGLPKPIVHSQGGILLEHLKKMNLHVDAQEGDRIFWFTTTGWMMWNFVVGCLLTPASIVLYDGNPGHPDMGALWDLAERRGDHHLRDEPERTSARA